MFCPCFQSIPTRSHSPIQPNHPTCINAKKARTVRASKLLLAVGFSLSLGFVRHGWPGLQTLKKLLFGHWARWQARQLRGENCFNGLINVVHRKSSVKVQMLRQVLASIEIIGIRSPVATRKAPPFSCQMPIARRSPSKLAPATPRSKQTVSARWKRSIGRIPLC